VAVEDFMTGFVVSELAARDRVTPAKEWNLIRAISFNPFMADAIEEKQT
jgi:hypothetical protein